LLGSSGVGMVKKYLTYSKEKYENIQSLHLR
jgi:hypothetical protein